MSRDREGCDGVNRDGDSASRPSAHEESTLDPIAEFLRSIGSPGFGSADDAEFIETDL